MKMKVERPIVKPRRACTACNGTGNIWWLVVPNQQAHKPLSQYVRDYRSCHCVKPRTETIELWDGVAK